MEKDFQKLVLGAYLLHLMTEQNGGQEPRTIWQYRRVGRRFGFRIRVLPAEALQGALLRRGQRAEGGGVIYIRKRPNMAQMRRELLHELGEAAALWEGVSPCVCQISRHEAACTAVDLRFRSL